MPSIYLVTFLKIKLTKYDYFCYRLELITVPARDLLMSYFMDRMPCHFSKRKCFIILLP